MNTSHRSNTTAGIDQPVPRRFMLRHAGIAAGTVALATVGVSNYARGGTEPPGTANTAEQLAGSWMINRQDDGTPPNAQGVFSFTAGGVVIYHDIAPVGALGTGTWAAADDGTCTSTFWAGFDADPAAGTPSVTAQVRALMRVDGDTLSGTYDTTIYDTATHTELIELTGTFTGSRIDG